MTMQEAYIISLQQRNAALERENEELKSQLKIVIGHGTKVKISGAKKQVN